MKPIRCPETSVKDYHSTLRNTPEERKILTYNTVHTVPAVLRNVLRILVTIDRSDHRQLRGPQVLIRLLGNSTCCWREVRGWQCQLCGWGKAGPAHTVATHEMFSPRNDIVLSCRHVVGTSVSTSQHRSPLSNRVTQCSYMVLILSDKYGLTGPR
jgi:hypothetical protein